MRKRKVDINHVYGAQWPEDLIKQNPRPSRYKVSLQEAIGKLSRECAYNKLRDVSLETNIKYNAFSGYQKSAMQTFHFPAIVRYTTKSGVRKLIAYDRYERTACNIYAIADYMERQRKIYDLGMHILVEPSSESRAVSVSSASNA